MKDYEPISCELHDHVEIACMHRYRLRIRATGGRILTGTASYTVTTPDKAEYLELDVNGTIERLRLDEIVQIEPLSPHASFGVGRFRPSC